MVEVMGLELARCSCITQSDPVILYVPNILEHYSIHWFGNNWFIFFFFKIPLRTDNWTPVYGSALQYLPLLTISNHLYHSWNTAIYGNVDSLSSRHYSTSEIRNKKKKYFMFSMKSYKYAQIDSTVQQNSLCLNVFGTLAKQKPSAS